MPESETEEMDYYPAGWVEDIHDESYIEWRYEDDQTIVVRLDGTMDEESYSVVPITGLNEAGEEFVTRPVSQLTREEAFEIANTLVYALNGAVGRITGKSEFNEGRED